MSASEGERPCGGRITWGKTGLIKGIEVGNCEVCGSAYLDPDPSRPGKSRPQHCDRYAGDLPVVP